jgi:hypothetical protein
MSKTMEYRILSTLVCTLVFVSIAAAHEVSITYRAKVGTGHQLNPGEYRVEVVKTQDSAEVQFFKAGDLVVQAPVKLTQDAAKCYSTEVHYEEVGGEQVITQIRLAGSKERLVFKQDTSKTE